VRKDVEVVGESEPERDRAARALSLLERGRIDEARRELEALVGLARKAAGGSELAIDDEEIDRAFAVAAPERDAMLDADEIALAAMRVADLDEPEIATGVRSERGGPRHRTIHTLERWLGRLGRGDA
jgi:hypothetical protein